MANTSTRWQGLRRYGAPRVFGGDDNEYEEGDCAGSVDSAVEDRPSPPLASKFHAACHDEASGPVRNFLDAFSCLCVGSTEPSDLLNEENTLNHNLASSSTISSMDTPVAVSPRDMKCDGGDGQSPPDYYYYYRSNTATPRNIVLPVAYLGDPVGAVVERPTPQRSSSLPPKFFFRPVSEDNDSSSSGVGVGYKSKQQPWEA